MVVDDGVLNHVSKAEADPLALPRLGSLQEPFLLPEHFLPLIVGFDLLTAHALHQTLTLAQGKGLQQALVNFHLMRSENVT